MLVALAVAMTCCPHDDAGAASADEHHGTSAAECAEAGAAPNAASPSEERGIEGIAQETERRFVAACAALARHGGQAAGRSAAAEVFLPRFLALAQQGSLNAILWCLEHQ